MSFKIKAIMKLQIEILFKKKHNKILVKMGKKIKKKRTDLKFYSIEY